MFVVADRWIWAVETELLFGQTYSKDIRVDLSYIFTTKSWHNSLGTWCCVCLENAQNILEWKLLHPKFEIFLFSQLYFHLEFVQSDPKVLCVKAERFSCFFHSTSWNHLTHPNQINMAALKGYFFLISTRNIISLSKCPKTNLDKHRHHEVF